MLLIPCPNCGPRDETEFHYGGQAHVAYPENPAELTDREWAEYLFYRDNTKGATRWASFARPRAPQPPHSPAPFPRKEQANDRSAAARAPQHRRTH